MTPAREGSIRIFGQPTTDWPPYRIAGLGVGYVPEGRRIFSNLTVEENLKVPAERPGPWTIERIYELFPRLAERRSNRGRQLSGGEQEMLAIARALVLNPQLLMLDEPSQGLAPFIVQEVFKVVVAARDEGISVLLVEQNVRAALAIADQRLRAGRRPHRLFRPGPRVRTGRGAHPRTRRRERQGMGPALCLSLVPAAGAARAVCGQRLQEPEDEGDDDADQDAGDDRNVQAEAVPFDENVAGQPAKAEALDQRPGNSGCDQQQTDDDENTRHLIPLPRNHEGLRQVCVSSGRIA